MLAITHEQSTLPSLTSTLKMTPFTRQLRPPLPMRTRIPRISKTKRKKTRMRTKRRKRKKRNHAVNRERKEKQPAQQQKAPKLR